jgi:hypothetical protein
VISLSACSALSPQAEFIPEGSDLNKATIGVPYFYKIEILGGRVMRGWYRQEPGYTPGTVFPDKTGISIRNCLLPEEEGGSMSPKEPLYNGNCIEVYGTPTQIGKIKINLKGGMYGNMWAPASYFSKDYILNVVSP